MASVIPKDFSHMNKFITSNIWIPITIEPTEHTSYFSGTTPLCQIPEKAIKNGAGEAPAVELDQPKRPYRSVEVKYPHDS